MRTHIRQAASESRCAKYFKTQQRAVINPHDKYVYNSRWYMDTWILVYIIMGDKGADIPCAVATVTNNIIPTGVQRRRRRGITRPYTYLFISMGILYRCQEKKNSYTGQIPLHSLARISSYNRTFYIIRIYNNNILMYILIIILYYVTPRRRTDGTAQHLVETKRARILLCFNAFFHRRRRIIANMRTYNLPVPIHIYLLYADPTNKTVCLLFLCSETNCRAEHTHTHTHAHIHNTQNITRLVGV